MDIKKCITSYVDNFGNLGYGNVITLCEIIKKDGSDEIYYKIIEPKSFKERWPATYSGLKILPDNISEKYEVGFYTMSSHFKIMEDAGFIDILDENTKNYFKRITKERDKNSYRWYSNGLTIKKDISETQSELY